MFGASEIHVAKKTFGRTGDVAEICLKIETKMNQIQGHHCTFCTFLMKILSGFTTTYLIQ